MLDREIILKAQTLRSAEDINRRLEKRETGMGHLPGT